MLFAEALELLKARENMVRESWKPEDGYLVLMQGMTHIWKIMLHPSPNAGNYIFSVDDLSAKDWKKFVLAKPVIESV